MTVTAGPFVCNREWKLLQFHADGRTSNLIMMPASLQLQPLLGCAIKSHSEETPTVWPHMQDGGQQEVKDTDVQNE